MDLNVNKNHKDSVFSKLFSDPEMLRELYSAIEGVEIPKEAVISINTLSEVLFMKQINDLSFTIDDRLVVLIEHQSTINHNIPIRMLMYTGRVYEKIIKNKDIYQKNLLKSRDLSSSFFTTAERNVLIIINLVFQLLLKKSQI